jgi:hypothetical protein
VEHNFYYTLLLFDGQVHIWLYNTGSQYLFKNEEEDGADAGFS